jgi:hypothetical protein
MSIEITTSFVKQYSSNVFHLSQQKGSRLQDKVRNEMQKAEAAFYDRIGSVDAKEKTTRHSDVEYDDTPHSRRKVTMKDYYYSDLCDKEDKLRTLINPDSEYVKAAVWALGRKKDDIIISAALGNAYGGKEGATVIALPDSQKVAAFDGTTSTGVNLNIKTLRAVKQKFDGNDVDESISRHLAHSSFQLQSLLGENEITSADYNTIKALVAGEVDSFMGFKFVRLERLPRSASNITYEVASGVVGSGAGTITASKSRRCFAWAQDGLLMSKGKDVQARISELPQKHYAHQIYAAMSLGATRMEEVKVVEVICSE